MKPITALISFFGVAILGGAMANSIVACGDDHPCDEGQILRSNLCYCDEAEGWVQSSGGTGYGCEKKALPGPPSGSDAAASDALAEGDAPANAAGAFGAPCEKGGTECASPAPFCAVQPGQSAGYCTVEGCKDDPSVCPAGWSCLSFTATGFCAKP